MQPQPVGICLFIFTAAFASSQAFFFDCSYPFINCPEKNVQPADDADDDPPATTTDSSPTTVSYLRDYTYTFTYTNWFTSQGINRDPEATSVSADLVEALNISSAYAAISLMTRIDSLNLSNEGSVQAVNKAIETLFVSLNESQSSNTSTEEFIHIFDEAAKYVKLMDQDEAKKFLHVSSNALVASLNESGNAYERKNVVVKVEEYAVASASNFLEASDQNVVSMDLGSVAVTFCKSGSAECALESEEAEFESVKADDLFVTFIRHKILKNDPLSVNSIITSATAQNLSGSTVSIPVTFTLKHNKNLETESSSCVFLNVTTAEWSSDGCESIDVNSTHTRCFCNHTTNFAVLFLHSSVDITKADEFWFNLMTYVGCGVSITALIATMTIFVVLRLHRAERVILLWNLCFCLCSAQLILVAGTSAQVGTVACQIIAILLHFFFTASFSWMLMEGIHLYMKASNARGGKYKFKIILASGWALPICIISISMGIGLDQYGSGNACWLSITNGFVWAFIGPALGIIAMNSIVLIFVIKVFLGLKSISKTSEGERIKKATKAVLFLMPLLGITWIFGLLAFDESTKWFLYLFCICNSLQGLAIFILQCAKNDDVRKAFFKKYRRTFVSIGSYSSGASGSSNKTNHSYVNSDHPTKGLPTIAKW